MTAKKLTFELVEKLCGVDDAFSKVVDTLCEQKEPIAPDVVRALFCAYGLLRDADQTQYQLLRALGVPGAAEDTESGHVEGADSPYSSFCY